MDDTVAVGLFVVLTRILYSAVPIELSDGHSLA